MSIFKTVNIIAFGTEEGTYVEAQRMEGGRIRTGDINKEDLELWTTDYTGQKLKLEKIISNYDPRLRSWYKVSKEEKIPSWSDIYLLKYNNQPAISANQPYFSEKREISGVFSTSVTLFGICKFLSELSMSNKSSVLVIEPSGLTIASSENIPLVDDLNQRIHAASLENPILSDVSNNLLEMIKEDQMREVFEFPFKVNNFKYFIRSTTYYGPYKLKWYVIVIIPKSDYMSEYYRASILGIIFLILFLVIIGFMSYLIAGATAKPIVQLSHFVSQISLENKDSRELTVPEKVFRRKDEIGILAIAFSEMSERLNAAFYEIRLSEKRNRDLIEGTNSIIFRLEPDGTILFANDYALNYFGYNRNELIKKKLKDTLFPITAENGENQSGLIKNIFDDNEHYWLNENENMKKNGERVWVLWSNKWIENNGKVELLAIGQDITTRKTAEKELKKSLEEKNILLKEIHHRVKNNLQIITSLINLQLGDISNDKVQKTLESLQSRIQSMALVHEMLYSTESISQIDFCDYLYQIVKTISAANSRIGYPIQVSVDGDMLYLDIERSTTCGLLVNELIINAFKHAFKGQTDCKIHINITKFESGKIAIRVEDNGIGISTVNNHADNSGMGTLLVKALTYQLNGKMEIIENNGTAFILSFKI